MRTEPIASAPARTNIVPATIPEEKPTRYSREDRENALRVLEEIFNQPYTIRLTDLLNLSPRARALASELIKKSKLIKQPDGTVPFRGAVINQLEEINMGLGLAAEAVEEDLIRLLDAQTTPHPTQTEEAVPVNTLEVFLQDLTIPEPYFADSNSVLPAGSLICPDPVEAFLVENSGAVVKGMTVAEPTEKIRVFYPLVNRQKEEEAVIDEGSQVCSASESAALDLGISWDPALKIGLQSSNKSVATTSGMARNVPFDCGNGVVAFVQLHIVKDAAYKLLLGRPFLSVMTANSASRPNGMHTLALTDPNNAQQIVIPTYPRGTRPEPKSNGLAFRLSRI